MKLTHNNILNFFSHRRLHGSKDLVEFMATYLLDCVPEHTPYVDTIGNIHYDLRIDSTNRTLFTAHVDTVTHIDGMQRVQITNGVLQLHPNEYASTCLGADDGSGILVLLTLLNARVPAYYIFTQGEERGGIGAKHIATAYSKLLGSFDRAIAFDRKGTSSVISHQGWGRCCSDTFASSLSDALCTDTLMYAPDDTGVYTDTAEFVDIIPECTNVSVGYYNEHTKKETQDVQHLKDLCARVVAIDWDSLPTERDPQDTEDKYVYEPYKYDKSWGNAGMGGAREFGVYDSIGYAGKYDDTYDADDDSLLYGDLNMNAWEHVDNAVHGDPRGLGAFMREFIGAYTNAHVEELSFGEELTFTQDALSECLRALNYAKDEGETEDALLDLYATTTYYH